MNKKKYIVQSIVPEEIFKNFLDYLTDSKEPEITIDNLFYYSKLSKEFSLLNKVISSKFSESDIQLSLCKYSLNNLSEEEQQEQKTNNSETEKFIAQHLDDIIENFPNKLSEIPVTSLFNIFYNEHRILNDHEKAYHFIVSLLNDNNKQNISSLLGSLDGSKLKYETAIDSLANIEKHFGFYPKINSSRFATTEEMISALKKENQILNIQNSQFEEKLSQMEQKVGLYQKDFENMKDFFHELSYISLEKENIDLIRLLVTESHFDVNHLYITKEEEEGIIPEIKKKEENNLPAFEEEEENLPISKEEEEEKDIITDLETILGKKIGQTKRTKEEKTALHIAIEKNNLELVQILLSLENIDVNLISTTKIELDEYYYHHYLEIPKNIIFQTLIEIEKTPLCLAIEKDNLEIVRLLLENERIDVNKQISIEQNFQEEWKTLEEKAPLHFAVEKGNLEIVKLLLSKKDIDVNSEGLTRSPEKLSPKRIFKGTNAQKHIKYYKDNPEKIDSTRKGIYFMEHIDKTLTSVEKPLHIAIKNQYLEIIDLLLKDERTDVKAKASIKKFTDDYKNRNFIGNSSSNTHDISSECKLWTSKEKTPLQIAIKTNNEEVVQLLLKHDKIDINEKICVIKGSSKKSHIWDAENMNDPDYVKIEHEKEFQIKEEKTILHYAIKIGNSNIVNFLLSLKNIDVNDKLIRETDVSSLKKCPSGKEHFTRVKQNEKKEEETVLQYAIEKGNTEIIKLLLNREDIDINAKSITTESKNRIIKAFYKWFYVSDAFLPHCSELKLDWIKKIVKESSNDKEIIRRIVTIEKNIKKKDQKTLLQIAIEKKNLEIIQLLLSSNDIDVNDKSILEYETANTYLPFSLDNSFFVKYKLFSFIQDNQNCTLRKESYKEEKPAFHFAILSENIDIINLFFTRSDFDGNITNMKEKQTGILNQCDDCEVIVEDKLPNQKFIKAKFDFTISALASKQLDLDFKTFEEDSAVHVLFRNYKPDYSNEKNFSKEYLIDVIQCLIRHPNIKLNMKNINGERPIDLNKNLTEYDLRMFLQRLT